MQNLHESSPPIQLERLLQVPLQVIPLEDLLREKSSSVSPTSNSANGNINGGNRLCRSADSQLPSSKSDKAKEILNVSKSLSTSCIFDCCSKTNPKNKSGKRSSKARFKTASLKLPDGSIAVIPVMDVGDEDTDTDIETQKDSDEERRRSEEASGLGDRLPRRGSHERAPRRGSSSSSASVSPRAPETGSVILGKVIENPTRYEDFLIAHECRIRNAAAAAASARLVDGDAGESIKNGLREMDRQLSDLDTLKLTFYNDGRKESVKEYSVDAPRSDVQNLSGDNMGYYENQHGLQMSRIVREERAGSNSSGESQRQRSASFGGRPNINSSRSNDNTHQHPYHFNITRTENTFNIGNNQQNNIGTNTTVSAFTQPQLRLTSSIIKNLNNQQNSNATRRGESGERMSWDQWEKGMKISRCQKEKDVSKIIELDKEANNNSIHHNNQMGKLAERNSHVQEGNEKGESENSVDRHLQSYLTSLKYVKPAGNERELGSAVTDRDNVNKRIPMISPVGSSKPHLPHPNHSPVVHAGPLRASPQRRSPLAAGVPSSPVARRFTPSASIPHHQVSPPQPQQQQQQQSQSLESWSEKAIARIPTRPYLRRNITYEQHPAPQRQQPQPISLMGTAVATTPMHSPPKRFKSTPIPANPLMHSQQTNQNRQQPQQQHHQQQHHQQQPAFVPGRYPNSANNSIAVSIPLSGTPTGNGDHHHHQLQQQQQQQQQQQHQQQHRPLQQQSYPITRNPIVYNEQQQLQLQSYQQARSSYGVPTSVSNNQQSHHSPLSQNIMHAQQQHQQKHQQVISNHAQPPTNQHNRIHESMMNTSSTNTASVPSANTSSSVEPTDQSSYYERLRHYWEYYQRQEVDWTKLAEYYQKYNFYPWDILTARDESILHQWKNQQQQQSQLAPTAGTTGHVVGRGLELDNMTQHQQHQLALRAMNAASTVAASPSAHKTIAPYSPTNRGIPVQQQPGRIAKVVDLSPPLSSHQPASHQQLQQKYNQTSHSQQLQQLHQMQHQQRQYQHQIQQVNQSQQQQQQQQHPHHQIMRVPQQEHISHQQQRYAQSRPQYPSQLQQQRIQQGMAIASNYDAQPNYENAYNQLAVAAVAAASGSALTQGQIRSTGSSIPGKVQVHHPIATVVPPPAMMTVGEPIPAVSPDEVSYPVNIHRHTLELAIKNNFKGAHPNTAAAISSNPNYGMANGGLNMNMIGRRRLSVSPPPITVTPKHFNQQQQNSFPGPKIVGRVDDGSSTGSVGSMSTMSPTPLTHQTSVIRRIQQQQLPPTANRKTPVHTRSPTASITMNNMDKEKSLNLKRKISIISDKFKSSGKPVSAFSPIPLIAGEEELVTANVSPSAVLAAVNAVDEEDLPRGVRNADEDGNGGPHDSNGGVWQYDHVVLLDKRIKTYMCKRCFETLKTEQQIRNHLFCKMLANNVQCHVCLQIVQSDQYPEHLQIHGIRPPDELTPTKMI